MRSKFIDGLGNQVKSQMAKFNEAMTKFGEFAPDVLKEIVHPDSLAWFAESHDDYVRSIHDITQNEYVKAILSLANTSIQNQLFNETTLVRLVGMDPFNIGFLGGYQGKTFRWLQLIEPSQAPNKGQDENFGLTNLTLVYRNKKAVDRNNFFQSKLYHFLQVEMGYQFDQKLNEDAPRGFTYTAKDPAGFLVTFMDNPSLKNYLDRIKAG